MNQSQIVSLAEALLSGQMSVDQFVQRLSSSGPADPSDIRLDLDRARRCGFPEVVFAEGKTTDTLKRIFAQLIDANQPVLATRVSNEHAEQLLRDYPDAVHNAVARTVRVGAKGEGEDVLPRTGHVVIVTAGTCDRPIAEEALETLDWMGVDAHLVQDVGVAGPHRLPAHVDQLTDADVVIVVAGMEGALPSVVGGYVACPVIGVPTSVGYGANFAGAAALLAMLNSCAANVTVVNIDGGFKAGYVAGLIARGKWAAKL